MRKRYHSDFLLWRKVRSDIFQQLSAPKDRQCIFCSQWFTSSSLGRHYDQFVKPNNPKVSSRGAAMNLLDSYNPPGAGWVTPCPYHCANPGRYHSTTGEELQKTWPTVDGKLDPANLGKRVHFSDIVTQHV
jgi:hypothetical protein